MIEKSNEPLTGSPDQDVDESAPYPDLYLTTAQSAKYLNCSKSFLDKARVAGSGPAFIRAGKRKILYRKSDLDDWAAARSYSATSEYLE